MSVKHAIYDVAHFKALDDGDEGQFEALVSVYGNVDKQGDRVVKGAFDATLAEWKATGAPIPIIWSHNWGDPNAHIGSADPNDVVETDAGLKVAGRIDLDNPFAAQVFRLLKERRVKEFSFGYEVRKEKRSKDGANELTDLGLIEVGPTLKGANPSTELLAVKSDLEAAAGEKAGRRISKTTAEKLSALRERAEAMVSDIDFLLSEGDSTDEEKDIEADEAKTQVDEPKATDRTLIDLQALIINMKGD